MRTIAVLNSKGGCGKTAVATGLAASLAWEGYNVALGDMDSQQSSTDWLSRRPAEYPPITGLTPGEGRIRAPADTDFLVLDSPAAIHGPELAGLVRRAQTLLVPILPSHVDMVAARRFLGHLFKFKPVTERKARVGLIANRVKAHTIIFRELVGFLDRYRAPFVAQFRDSMNYVRAFERGLAANELPPYLAERDWEEWDVLLDWVRSRRSVGRS